MVQIEEKTPAPVKQPRKDANAMAEKVADKVRKVATPVSEVAAPKRVSTLEQVHLSPQRTPSCPSPLKFLAFAYFTSIQCVTQKVVALSVSLAYRLLQI